MLSAETIQNIKSHVDIADIVGQFVRLKQRGEALVGYCPFHDTQEPTLVVAPEKGIFFCTHCQRGGDALHFLMAHDHCSEEEALLWLARHYQVPLPPEAQGDQLYRLSLFAQQWFAHCLWHDEMGQAIGLSYLRQRGLSDDIIRRFGLGYCPEQWNAFGDSALREGFTPEALVETGLCVRRDNGTLYDRFRARVTFPIYSVSGRVVGFSCRILRNDKEAAKYVNSPESPIYDKGAILYGLHQAKQAIAEKEMCYLVEGNLDVVSMHQSGVENTVASCGTALTPLQVRLLRQSTERVTIVYDGDKAGVKATMRAAELCFKEGMHVRMVLFPDDHDPDSYARQYGDQALRQYLEEHEEDYVEYSFRVLSGYEVKGYEVMKGEKPQNLKTSKPNIFNDPIRKAEAMRNMVKAIALVGDRMERDAYINKMATRFHVSERTMQNDLAKTLTELAKKAAEPQPAAAPPPPPPDDLFLPEEFQSEKAQIPNPQLPTPNSPDEPQERKLISLLLNHGRDIIEVPVEEGKTEKDYVAIVIVSDILASELTFDNPLYLTIFQEYVDAINHGELPSPDYFIHYPEPTLRTTAISLMVNPYHVSPKWIEKHVAVQRIEDHLDKDVIYSLLTFKLHKLDHQVETLDRDIRLTRDPDESLTLVAKKRALLNNRKIIANELNCVYN